MDSNIHIRYHYNNNKYIMPLNEVEIGIRESFIYECKGRSLGTGIKDINEIEIFENDVVEFTTFDVNKSNTLDWKIEKALIKFNPNYGFVLRVKKCDNQFSPITKHTLIDSKVIGNIIDNPELMESDWLV